MLENKGDVASSVVKPITADDSIKNYHDELGNLTHYYLNTLPTKIFLSDLGEKGVEIKVNEPVDLLSLVKEDEINHNRDLANLKSKGALKRLTVDEYKRLIGRFEKIQEEDRKIKEADYERSQRQMTDPDAALRAKKSVNTHTAEDIGFPVQSAVEKFRLYRESLKNPDMMGGATGWGPERFIMWLETQKLNQNEVDYIAQSVYMNKEIIAKLDSLYSR